MLLGALEPLHESDLFLSHVLRCFCVLQLSRRRSQWNCGTVLHQSSDLNVKIWTKQCIFSIFFRVNRGFVAEKSWLACATGFKLVWTALALEVRLPGDFLFLVVDALL